MATLSPAIERVLDYLKLEIKRQGLTYPELAQRLGTSPATVKRLLNSGSLSLDRLEELAGVLQLSLERLLAKISSPPVETTRLSWEQEEALAKNLEALTYYFALRDGQTPAKIAKEHGISQASTRRYLRFLEELQLVEVMPGDLVRVTDPAWRFLFIPNGPLNAVLFPRRLKNVFKRIEERGQPNIFEHPTREGWLGRYMSMLLDPEQYSALLSDLYALFDRYDKASANGRIDTPGRELVSICTLVDKFDVFDGVLPKITEI